MTNSSSGIEILLIPVALIALFIMILFAGAVKPAAPAVVSYAAPEPALAPSKSETDEIALALTALQAEVVEDGETWDETAHDLPSVPVEAIPMLPVSRHAMFDHPERTNIEKILEAWRLGNCRPIRVYFGCDNGTTQIAACRSQSGLWYRLTIGLRPPPTISGKCDISTVNLEQSARSHHCSPPVLYP
jgi:hypothetical protein